MVTKTIFHVAEAGRELKAEAYPSGAIDIELIEGPELIRFPLNAETAQRFAVALSTWSFPGIGGRTRGKLPAF